MHAMYQSFTVLGRVEKCSAVQGWFDLKLLSGDVLRWRVSHTTSYDVLRNVGEDTQDRVDDPSDEIVRWELSDHSDDVIDAAHDRIRNPPEDEVQRELSNRPTDPVSAAWWDARRLLIKYVTPNRLLFAQGVLSENQEPATQSEARKFDARKLVLMGSDPTECAWEQNQWWLHQIYTLIEQWLDALFRNRQNVTEDDFAQFYRTNLDIVGESTSDATQESATLSRFIYGLSSAYLLTGNPRALKAARAGSTYLINKYSDLREGGRYCLWKFGRVRAGRGTKQIFPSNNSDDRGTYALYEQIYCLSGLAQYYRITQDVWVLSYIVRTLESFKELFLDSTEGHPAGDTAYTGAGGFYSHIDYVTLRPDSPALASTSNRLRKNWNSIGDHIPAYLINLLSAIDPLPESERPDEWKELLTRCRGMLDNCVENILTHFGPDDGSAYVQERFHADWKADRTWGWQQNRAIVGHNLKVCWNLTRCGHYYQYLADQLKDNKKYLNRADQCFRFAHDLGSRMREVGMDLIRGGIFDAVERKPRNGMPIEFAWDTTKDFWQQEQAILAYYIMHGLTAVSPQGDSVPGENGTGGAQPSRQALPDFLDCARACSAFWNMFFVDQDNRRIFFRTTESGMPVISGQYGAQAGHAIAGYHAFELNYLAHIYIQSYVKAPDRGEFNLFFCPVGRSSIKTLNVLPDFFSPETVEIAGIRVNGLTIEVKDRNRFQIDISKWPQDSVYEVQFCRASARQRSSDVYEEVEGEALVAEHLPRSGREHRLEFPQAPARDQGDQTPVLQFRRPL